MTRNFQGEQFVRRAENFLRDWANIPGESSPNFHAALERVTKRYPEYLNRDEVVNALVAHRAATAQVTEIIPKKIARFLLECLPLLRIAWGAKNTMYIARLRIAYVESGLYFPLEEIGSWDTPDTDFDRAMIHLERLGDLAKVCGNPDCPAKYFIADKRAQRYCGAQCAALVLREQKQVWWAENRGKHANKSKARKR